MSDDDLADVAKLLATRNELDARLATITRRPMTAGHLGEWIASQVFDIELEPSASARGIDGRFRSGPLAGSTVNIKWYLKREGILDVASLDGPDFYLVMAGPPGAAASSHGSTRPWVISSVHLFEASDLQADLQSRVLRVGIATSVRAARWAEAEIFPRVQGSLALTEDQRLKLKLFRPE